MNCTVRDGVFIACIDGCAHGEKIRLHIIETAFTLSFPIERDINLAFDWAVQCCPNGRVLFDIISIGCAVVGDIERLCALVCGCVAYDPIVGLVSIEECPLCVCGFLLEILCRERGAWDSRNKYGSIGTECVATCAVVDVDNFCCAQNDDGVTLPRFLTGLFVLYQKLNFISPIGVACGFEFEGVFFCVFEGVGINQGLFVEFHSNAF